LDAALDYRKPNGSGLFAPDRLHLLRLGYETITQHIKADVEK
jgi:hypothetical protein